MKIVSQEDVRGYTDSTIEGGIKGALVAVALSVPGHFFFKKNVAAYRTLPLPLKSLAYVMVGVPCISIFAEKAGEAYNRGQYTGVGQKELDYELEKERENWEKLSSWQKSTDWAARHKYGIIGAGWAASMGLAFAIVARNPYQSTSQKVVQARMWAQGLTVALLVGSAALTGIPTGSNGDSAVHTPHADHSWRRMLEMDESLTAAERAQLKDESDPSKLKDLHESIAKRKQAAAGKA
ncbi:hypothetical protein B9479_001784 [Cryptococcus floricola]|uniref:HIG1 domain-containing protein n=1 Tax=Cryptococcus floricola TaxID=2591691 RepID=A0A5D3B136_9TREE|nr:hypothetical protein B9479_001784 [Cryptococcus floricola]